MAEPAGFDYMRLAHPPVTFRHEKLKVERAHPGRAALHRRASAQRDLRRRARRRRPDRAGRALQRARPRAAAARAGRCVRRLAAADPRAERRLSAGARPSWRRSAPASVRCWWSRRASRNTSSRRSSPRCAGSTCRRRCTARTCCRRPASTRSRCIAHGLAAVLRAAPAAARPDARRGLARRQRAAPRCGRQAPSAPLPARPPGFCIGCPERPVFAALKLAQQEVGPVHIAADIGCHAFGDLRAVLVGPLDPRLRHEPGEPRRRVADDEAPHAGDHGRRRLLAQRPADRRAERAVQRRRRGAGDHQERLHLGHRHAGHHLDARRRGEGCAPPTSTRASSTSNQTIERTLDRPGRAVAAHRAHLRRRRRCGARSRRRSPRDFTA